LLNNNESATVLFPKKFRELNRPHLILLHKLLISLSTQISRVSAIVTVTSYFKFFVKGVTTIHKDGKLEDFKQDDPSYLRLWSILGPQEELLALADPALRPLGPWP
jgi:hypothetical protein